MSNSSKVEIDPRLTAQIEAFNWLLDQVHNDMTGDLLRAWLVQKRTLIERAGGTPPPPIH